MEKREHAVVKALNKLRIKSLLIAFAALAVFAVTVAGQVTGGAVTGTVLDPNGGAVVGATVLLHDKTRGQDHTAETTSAGSYSFPNVPTGTYTMTITASGFSDATGEVVVSLNQTATANVTLSVASATARVTAASAGLPGGSRGASRFSP